MAIDVLSNLDFKKNQILNVLLQMIAGDHGTPQEALIWYDSTAHVIKYRDNTTIQTLATAAGSGVAASTWDAQSVVVAVTDNTPVAQVLAASQILGRKSTGNIGAMSMAELVTELLAADGSGSLLDADKLDGQEGTYYLARGNHSGTQTASTISDFDTQVRTSRLDQMAAPTASVSLNSQKITNLLTPAADTDAATKGYVDSIAQGLSAKTSVRVATTAAATLATGFENGDTIDGVVLATGDRVLVKDQAAPAENGIYTVNASGAPTRAVDMDSNAEVQAGLYVFVEEGTANADSGWVLTTDGAITIGTTGLSFVQFTGAGQITAGAALTKTGNTLDVAVAAGAGGIEISSDALRISTGAAGTGLTGGGGSALAIDTSVVARKYSTTCAAATSTAVSHNLGTRNVQVQVWRSATPWDTVMCDVERTDTNTVTVRFAVAPSAGEFTITVIG